MEKKWDEMIIFLQHARKACLSPHYVAFCVSMFLKIAREKQDLFWFLGGWNHAGITTNTAFLFCVCVYA